MGETRGESSVRPDGALERENASLRGALRQLATGLEDGHQALAASLVRLLEEAPEEQPEVDAARRRHELSVSQRQVSLYIAFLRRAVAIARKTADEASACAAVPRESETAMRSGTARRQRGWAWRFRMPGTPRVAPRPHVGP
jgi:hypothetical protein